MTQVKASTPRRLKNPIAMGLLQRAADDTQPECVSPVDHRLLPAGVEDGGEALVARLEKSVTTKSIVKPSPLMGEGRMGVTSAQNSWLAHERLLDFESRTSLETKIKHL